MVVDINSLEDFEDQLTNKLDDLFAAKTQAERDKIVYELYQLQGEAKEYVLSGASEDEQEARRNKFPKIFEKNEYKEYLKGRVLAIKEGKGSAHVEPSNINQELESLLDFSDLEEDIEENQIGEKSVSKNSRFNDDVLNSFSIGENVELRTDVNKLKESILGVKKDGIEQNPDINQQNSVDITKDSSVGNNFGQGQNDANKLPSDDEIVNIGQFFDEQEKIVREKNFLEAFNKLSDSKDEKDFLKNYEKVKELSSGLGNAQAEDANELKKAMTILKNLEDDYEIMRNDIDFKDILTLAKSKTGDPQTDKIFKDFLDIENISNEQFEGSNVVIGPNDKQNVEGDSTGGNIKTLEMVNNNNTGNQGLENKQIPTGTGSAVVKSPLDVMKEKLARHILEVAGLSDGQIVRILNGVPKSKAKAAIMNRVETLLKNVGVEKGNLDAIKEREKDGSLEKSLRGEVERQAKELIAQTGRANSWSLDKQDMRERGELHKKYTNKANKMDGPTFDKNLTKALEYEVDKDDGNTKSNAWKTIPRLLGHLREKYKVIVKPIESIILASLAIAYLSLFPPANVIFFVFFMLKAIKNGIYDDSRLQKWMNENWFVSEHTPEKFNSDALDKVNVKGLFEGKDKTQGKSVEEKKVVEEEKVSAQNQSKNQDQSENQDQSKSKVINDESKANIPIVQDKQSDLQNVQNITSMSWQPKGKIEDVPNLLDRRSQPNPTDNSVVPNNNHNQGKSTQNGSQVNNTGIEVNRGADSLKDDQKQKLDKIVDEIKKSLPKGRAMDDLDLMQAKHRLSMVEKQQKNKMSVNKF